MVTPIKNLIARQSCSRWITGGLAVAGLLLSTAGAYSDDDVVTMAPPIQPAVTQSASNGLANPSLDTVFNWSEIPQNQEVPITRAVFDQGGYQLYDTVGETVVVPFTDQNLYIMKFGLSKTGDMYFVNDNGVPVLYVPKDGYLENATVSGAKWYPFSADFQPSEPVYMGIAPNWPDYVDMGWYPDMNCYGGYWCSYPGDSFIVATVGFVFIIGGHDYYGWHQFHDYCLDHRPPFHTTFRDRDVYQWASHRPYWAQRSFQGTHENLWSHRVFNHAPAVATNRSVGGIRTFEGQTHTFRGTRSLAGDSGMYLHRESPETERTFQGDRPEFNDSRTFEDSRPYVGSQRTYTAPSATFGGVRTFDAPRPERTYEPTRTYEAPARVPEQSAGFGRTESAPQMNSGGGDRGVGGGGRFGR
jgi:hypothetical protein